MKTRGIIPAYHMPTKADLLLFDSFISMGDGTVRRSEKELPTRYGTAHFTNPRHEELEAAFAWLRAERLIEEEGSRLEDLLDDAQRANLPVADIRSKLAILNSAANEEPHFDFGQLPPVDSGIPRSYRLRAEERYTEYASNVKARIYSLLRSDSANVITPILEDRSIPVLAGRQSDLVLQVAIQSFPVPGDEISIEDIIAFKRDKKVEGQLQLFRRWIRKTVAREGATASEIGEEIADNLADFRNSMELAKMRYRTERLYTLLTLPLATIERIVKLQFSQLFEPVFSLRKAKLSLLEAELKAPGRELAYINASLERFGRSGASTAQP